LPDSKSATTTGRIDMDINEEHVGSDATEKQARGVAAALRFMGYDVSYGPCREWTEEEREYILDDDWSAAIVMGAK
jgi:hypothetical protein